MERPCDACAEPYEAKTKRSRFCDRIECKRERDRVWRAERRAGGVVLPLPAPDGETDDLAAATRKRLEDAGRLGSPEGHSAMFLAERLMRGARDSGSSVAALHREYRAAMELALKDAERAADPIDQLRMKTGERRLSVVR